MIKRAIVLLALAIIQLSNAGMVLFAQPTSQSGAASYYADAFNGRKTASGIIFSNEKFYAAHKTLPFGTLLKVTNRSNKKWCVVTVVDRGPYIKGRIIDLSRAVADSLGFTLSGTAEVLIEEITIANEQTLLPPVARRLTFPYSWCGTWSGELLVYDAQKLKMKIPMILYINPTIDSTRWEWMIQYDTIKRHYELILDIAKNEYAIDEKNGIVIPVGLFNNTLVSSFDVQDNRLNAIYRFTDGGIEFIINSASISSLQLSGGELYNNEHIPRVGSYPVSLYQEALLKRE